MATEVVLRDNEWYLRGISQAMFNSDSVYSWIHSHFREAYTTLQATHKVDAAILGDFCEAFSKLFVTVPAQRKQCWKTDDFLAEFDNLPLPNYRPANRAATLALFKEDVRSTAIESMQKDIAKRYTDAATVATDPLIVGDYFFRWQRVSCLATFQMFNDVRGAGPERNLMFDKDLHQLLEIMPAKIRAQSNLGSRIVNKIRPKAAWIPNANTLLPLPFPQAAHALSKAMRPKLGKLRRLLFSDTYRTTASWPHLPMLYAGHPAWKKHIEERVFDKRLLQGELFDHKAIEKCWCDFCSGDLSRHADIERLLGLAELSSVLQQT